MALVSPVVLVLGAGGNIGQAVANKFASQGYKVALAARSLKESDSTVHQLHIPSDLADTGAVLKAFAKVTERFGLPGVVVYNASAVHFTPAEHPFAARLEDLMSDTTVNIHSAFVAAQKAVESFSELPNSAAKTFIYTGNILNEIILPGFVTQGVGKSGAAHMIRVAADAYKGRGYKFYYVDERKRDGSAKYHIDGAAHADLFFDLAEDSKQRPWQQTFVAGEGYKDFAKNA